MNMTFWMYPDKVLLNDSAFTDSIDPRRVAKPEDAVVDSTYDRFFAAATTNAAWHGHRVVYGFPNPATDLLAVTKLTLYARYWREQFGPDMLDLGAGQPLIYPIMYFPATQKFFAGTSFTVSNFANRNTQAPAPVDYTYAWTVNPMTGVAFTQADMAGTFGVGFCCGSTHPPGTGNHLAKAVGANQAAVCFSQCILMVECSQVTGGNPNGVRALNSYMLKLARKTPRTYVFTLPFDAAQLNPGDHILVAEETAPHVTAGVVTGWTETDPRRLVVLEREVSAEATVKIKAFDPRDFATHLWSPLRTNINDFTGLMHGLAVLDGGFPGALSGFVGGMANWRNQLGYVDRLDGLVVTVPADVPKLNHEGWWVEGEQSVNQLLNSSFSQGAGNAFTSWAVNPGYAVNESSDFLYDVAGLRRSARLVAGLAPGWALYQGVAFGAGAMGRLAIEYKTKGAQVLYVLLASENGGGAAIQYFNFTTHAWQVPQVWNALPLSATKTRWFSEAVTQSVGGGVRYGVYLALASGGGTSPADDVIMYECALFYNYAGGGTNRGNTGVSRLPTTTVAVTRVSDDSYFASDPDSVPGIDPRNGGAFFFTYKPKWGRTTDLLDAFEHKFIARLLHEGHISYDEIHVAIGATNATYLLEATRRRPKLGAGASNPSNENVASVTNTIDMVKDTPVRIALRWTGDAGELGKVRAYGLWANGTKLAEVTWDTPYIKPVIWDTYHSAVSVVRNSLVRNSGAAWDSGAFSTGQYIPSNKSGVITFYFNSYGAVGGAMCGLTKTLPGGGGSYVYNNLRYGWYVSPTGGGRMEAYENGAQVYNDAGAHATNNWTVGRVEVNRGTGFVYYYINDVCVATTAAEAVNLYPQVAFYDNGLWFYDVCLYGPDVVGASGACAPPVNKQAARRLTFSQPDMNIPALWYGNGNWRWGPAVIYDVEHKPFAPTDEEMAKWSRQ